jgi:hypothetical protein
MRRYYSGGRSWQLPENDALRRIAPIAYRQFLCSPIRIAYPNKGVTISVKVSPGRLNPNITCQQQVIRFR